MMNCAGPNLRCSRLDFSSRSIFVGNPEKKTRNAALPRNVSDGMACPDRVSQGGGLGAEELQPLESNRHVHCHVITALDDPSWTIKSLGDYRVDLCIWSLTCRILEDLIPPGRKRSTAPCKSPSASTTIRSCSQGKVDN